MAFAVFVCLFTVVCHLESSGKWPDDLDAIGRVKAAFYLRLAAMLEKQFSMTTVPTAACLHVVLVSMMMVVVPVMFAAWSFF